MSDEQEHAIHQADKGETVHVECIESPESPDVAPPRSIETDFGVRVFETAEEISTKSVGKGFEVELDFESDLNIKEEREEKNDDKSEKEMSDCEKDKVEPAGDDVLAEKKLKVEKELEEGEERDEGELLSDDEDELEEGELKEKDTGQQFPGKQPTARICRFFNRGKCTFGEVCRFLHLNHNARGNYSMFPNPNLGERYLPNAVGAKYPGNMDPAMIHPRRSLGEENFFIPAPAPVETSAVETAWERGLRTAKELVKKAHVRRGASPDFDEKRLNLSLSDVPENDKENEKKKDRSSFYSHKYDEEEYPFPEPSFYKRGYDNFEIRYRDDVPYRGEREKAKTVRREGSLERDNKMSKGMRRYDNDRLALCRKRAEEWFDPYRRSKSPKGQRRSRSRSGSYSTVSSYSYSERSSISYSRSSSGSSCDSSRSPSPLLSKRKSPNEGVLSPKCENRFLSRKKSSGRSSSRSRSLSMDSITSLSSGSLRGNKSDIAVLSKKEEKPEDGRATEIFQQLQFLKKEKNETRKINVNKCDDLDDPVCDLMSEAPVPTFPSLQHLLPTTERKEPAKGLQKQPIKLTLLNKKSQPSKFPGMPKEIDSVKCKQIDDESSKFNAFHPGVKRPLSPQSPVIPAKLPPSLIPKKSASSRRDELLKQLKAVEDAIARKRAKFC